MPNLCRDWTVIRVGVSVRLRGSAAILVLLCAAIGYLGYRYARLEGDLLASRARAAQSARDLQVERERGERLRARIAELETDSEIEKLARERLGLTKPGEIRYTLQPRKK